MTPNLPPELRDADAVPASTRVIEAIARAERTDPLNLGRPLYQVVDTDALDTLCRTGSSTTTVAFTYLGYRVTVGSDGEVSVDELDE